MMRHTIFMLFCFVHTELLFGQIITNDFVDTSYFVSDSLGNPILVLDTVYHVNGAIKEVGKMLLPLNSMRPALKVGNWVEFYEDGKFRSSGVYKVDVYGFCSFKYVWIYYSFKAEHWVYYHSNGTVKAEGSYRIKQKKRRHGGCSTEIYDSYIDRSWKFYDAYGIKKRWNQKFKNVYNWVSP